MSVQTESTMFDFVERNPTLVSVKEQANGLHVLKYKNRVFYKNLWTPELMECRGTVVEVNEDERKLKVIQRPFTKIFNFNERGTRIHRDKLVVASRKVNGFMAALTWYKGKPLVSTTGSCDSDFAAMAYAMLSETGAFDLAGQFGGRLTWIFEIVHPDDPHICPEEVGVYLLGSRLTEWYASQHFFDEAELNVFAQVHKLKRPEVQLMKFGDLVKLNKTVDHEGFVCWTNDGQELKLKSPHYLVTKFLARMRAEKLVQAIETDPDQLKTRIDEEFYPVVDHIASIKNEFADSDEQTRIGMIREFIEDMQQ